MSQATAMQTVKASPLYGLAAKFNVEPEKLLGILRGTVIKPDKNGKEATNEEVAAFCIVAEQFGLNPFTREIYAFTQPGKGVVPIVGVDGWVRIVNKHPQFDGVDFTDIATEDGKPSQITCTMHVKGRSHPIQVTERYIECKRDTPPWNTMPWRMLRHKAFMQAARYAFGLAGIFDEDEAHDIQLNMTPLREPIPLPRATDDKPASNGDGAAEGDEPQADYLEQCKARINELQLPPERIAALVKQAGGKSIAKLDAEQAEKLLILLGEIEEHPAGA